MNKNNTVNCAGGFIVQLMPDVTDEIIFSSGGESEGASLGNPDALLGHDAGRYVAESAAGTCGYDSGDPGDRLFL